MNKEKQLAIGIIRRFNNFFGPRDLEIYDHNEKSYGCDSQKYYRAIRKMKGKELKKEINRISYCIKLWRTETKKDRGKTEYIDFLTN